ncbi:MAG: glycosyltransferase family 2 protein [Candidatus Aenigmarchaeota archaeon]|nr:glycosyltransferase family 2 protein [Candidatus Aenigmarchaeota archaeon]
MIDIFLTILFSLLAVVNAILLGLFLLPDKLYRKFCPRLSVIIPAHNEEKYISKTIESVRKSDYRNKMEIIVVNDGSTDKTAEIVSALSRTQKKIRLFSMKHSGKSAALNFGIKKAKYDIVAFVDADSTLERKSLMKLVEPLADRNISISSGIIRARHTRNPLSWFQDIDYISSSGWRYACDKINATYISPGFAAFRKQDLMKVGGFASDTLTEDLDTTLMMRRSGYGAAMTRALMFTSVPSTLRSLVRQRIRWGRGSIQTAKKHSGLIFSRNRIGFYSFPMHLFWYPFSLFYLPFAIYWMFAVYFSSSISLPLATAVFFVKWVTVYGIADLLYNVLTGAYALTPLLLSILLSWSLSFAYLVAAARKFDAFSWKMLSYLVIFPYFWVTFAVQAYALVYESLSRSSGKNKWN